jgi:protein gp37
VRRTFGGLYPIVCAMSRISPDCNVTQNDLQRQWPLPNVWLGTSVENQEQADKRIPHLLKCPAAVRFLSVEPLLGPIDLKLRSVLLGNRGGWVNVNGEIGTLPGINWVIVGGESGAGARPMHPDWARAIRDQCAAADVPFFFKQWGEYLPQRDWLTIEKTRDVVRQFVTVNGCRMFRVGKHAAGRLLDGREWNDMPRVAAPEDAHAL